MDIFQYIFENAPVGIAICNAQENRLELVNPAFARIHGYEPHELIGVLPDEVFAAEWMQHAASSSDENFSFETVHTAKDGSSVHVAVHITVIKNEDGTIKHRMVNLININKRANAEMAFKLAQAIEYNFAKPINS